jgi:hypothetical protein
VLTRVQTRAFNKMIAGDKEAAAQRNRGRISEIAALVGGGDVGVARVRVVRVCVLGFEV